VEFFNPKLRHELEKKDAELIKKTGAKGAAPNGDQWVWLTSYSRIPVSILMRAWKRVSACTQLKNEWKKKPRKIRKMKNMLQNHLSRYSQS
jgi:hypothetical protein